jgi:integrase
MFHTLHRQLLQTEEYQVLSDFPFPATVVMEMMGHDSEQMSAHYTHVEKEAMGKAAVMPDLA